MFSNFLDKSNNFIWTNWIKWLMTTQWINFVALTTFLSPIINLSNRYIIFNLYISITNRLNYMIWYDVIWYYLRLYYMKWYDMMWYDMMLYDLIWYDMIWYDRYDMIWFDMIWYGVTNYNDVSQSLFHFWILWNYQRYV